jgi:hypothetical protein
MAEPPPREAAPERATSGARARRVRSWLTVLFLVLGLGGLAWTVHAIGPATLLRGLALVGPGFAGVLLLHLALAHERRAGAQGLHARLGRARADRSLGQPE